MKICVYAICKNESKHIKRWYESMKEADEIYVLDTGSTDNSVELLKNLVLLLKKNNIKILHLMKQEMMHLRWLRVTLILWYQLT